MIVIRRKLTQSESERAIYDIEKWFAEHPERRVCYTDLFKVRQGHIREDVLAHSEQPEEGL